jgi:MFS family permease
MGQLAVESRLAVARRIVTRRQAAAAILLGAALFLPAGMYEAIWARFLEDLGASTLFVGMTLTMYGVPFALTAAVAGRFVDRHGPWLASRFALLIIVPLTVVYGQLRSPWLLLSLAMVEAVGNGAGLPASQAAMVAATDETERAAGQIGAGLAALAAAPLYAGPGPGTSFAVVALIVAALGGAGLALARPTGRGRRQPRRLLSTSSTRRSKAATSSSSLPEAPSSPRGSATRRAGSTPCSTQ